MRNEIINLAEKQMMAGGYTNLNFGTIAKELDTTRANLHYHFKNKESLAIEVAKQYGNGQFSDVSALYEQFKDDFFTFIEKTEELFWGKVEEAGSTGICVCTRIATEPDLPDNLRALSQEFYRKFEGLHIDLVKNAIKNGQIRSDIDPVREGIRSHIIMIGIMTCGQHIKDPKIAREELGGFLIEWANSLK